MENLVIDATLELAATNFGEMLKHFWPAQKTETFCESNLTFQFAHAFLTKFPNGSACMELPYVNSITGGWHHHVDSYVFNDEVGIFVEAKPIYKVRHIEALLESDMGRLTPDGVKQVLGSFTDPSDVLERTSYKLALAESWYDDIADWWMDGSDSDERWDWNQLLGGYKVGRIQVGRYDDLKFPHLWWLYAYRTI